LLLPEPLEQVGVKPYRYDFLALRQHDFRLFPEFLVCWMNIWIGQNAFADL